MMSTVPEPVTSIASDPNVAKMLAHGRFIPLDPETKRPVFRRRGDVLKYACKDLDQIAAWEAEYPGCRWGLRIDPDACVLIIDAEAPHKGDGMASIAELESQHGKLPASPVAKSASGGRHLWFRISSEDASRIKNWSRTFPAVDLRVRNGHVVVPPSSGYEWITPLTDVEIPEAPGWLVDAILARWAVKERKPAATAVSSSVPERDECIVCAAPITAEPMRPKDWYRLRKCCPRWDSYWTRRADNIRDRSHSGWEFALAKEALCWGCTPGQVATIMDLWWQTTPVRAGEQPFNRARFFRAILPGAIKAAAPYVKAHADRKASEKAAKDAQKTPARVLAALERLGSSTPAEITKNVNADGLKMVTVLAVGQTLTRMVKHGSVERVEYGRYKRVKATTKQECSITPKMSECPAPVSAPKKPVQRASVRVPAEISWYAAYVGETVTERHMEAIRTHLEENAVGKPTTARVKQAAIIRLEEKTGKDDVTWFRDALNFYYRQVRSGAEKIEISHVSALKALQSLIDRSGQPLNRTEVVTFLQSQVRQPYPPKKLEHIISRIVVHICRRAA